MSLNAEETFVPDLSMCVVHHVMIRVLLVFMIDVREIVEEGNVKG